MNDRLIADKSSFILESGDAARNWSAALLMIGTIVLSSLVLFVGFEASTSSWALRTGAYWILSAFFFVAALIVSAYGITAVGLMLMDEARGGTSRPMMAAVLGALAVGHRLILAFLLFAAIVLGVFVVAAVVFFICKIPLIGPLLYTVASPIAVVVFGVMLFAIPTVVFPLAAPAIWSGATTLECVSHIIAISRKRLLMVLPLTFGVLFFALFAYVITWIILGLGAMVTGMLSVPILGASFDITHFMSLGGTIRSPSSALSFFTPRGGDAVSGYVTAAGVGGVVLVSLALTLPSLIYFRGICGVYLRARDGLDLSEATESLQSRLAEAKARARDLQASARAAADKYAVKTAEVPASGVSPASSGTAATDVKHCVNCGADVLPADKFCGACGHKQS